MKPKQYVLLLFVVGALAIVSCLKTKQRLFHKKDWTNIQGQWKVTQIKIDNIDSTIRWDSCRGIAYIGYQTDRERDGYLHLFHKESGSNDYGPLSIENFNYKVLFMKNYNFNIDYNFYYGTTYPKCDPSF